MRCMLSSLIQIAAGLVAVDGPDSLEVGVDDCAANETHAPLVKIAGDAVG
mgnify:CR=1 FL=1